MGELKPKPLPEVQKNKKPADVNQLSNTEYRWFAVYTKYKCEKYVAEHLQKKKIEAYIPLMTRTRRYARKIKQYDVPLINCYVFVHILKGQYIPTLETEYVMSFLKQGKDLIAIPQKEIDLLMRVAGDAEEAIDISQGGLMKGEEVEVTSGHLAGMRGIIVERTGKKSFIIDLNTIGYQIRINIDMHLLKPIKNKATTNG